MDGIVEETSTKVSSETTNEKTDENPTEITPNNSRIKFRWKGKIVKESTYKHKLALQESAKKRKLDRLAGIEKEPKIPVEGRRIIDLALFAKQMVCTSCKENLSLRDIRTETRRGLASILHIACRSCDEINCVSTSKHVTSKDSKSRLYGVNYDAVKGALEAGVTCTRLNKFLTALEIPQLQWKLFQRYKHEILGTSETDKTEKNDFPVDEVLDAAETDKNTDDIQKMLADFF